MTSHPAHSGHHARHDIAGYAVRPARIRCITVRFDRWAVFGQGDQTGARRGSLARGSCRRLFGRCNASCHCSAITVDGSRPHSSVGHGNRSHRGLVPAVLGHVCSRDQGHAGHPRRWINKQSDRFGALCRWDHHDGVRRRVAGYRSRSPVMVAFSAIAIDCHGLQRLECIHCRRSNEPRGNPLTIAIAIE